MEFNERKMSKKKGNFLFLFTLFILFIVNVSLLTAEDTTKKIKEISKPKPSPVAQAHRGCDAGNAADCTRLAQMYRKGKGVPQDKAKALALYQKACDAKDMAACFELADMYWNGEVTGWIDGKKGWEAFEKGVAINKNVALAMHQKACDGGYATGCYNLGVMYANGEGVAQDNAKAVALYQKACDGGIAAGCNNLGYMYENGEGVAQDKAKAVAFYQKACNGGLATGCFNLGGMYANGEGVAQDKAKAVAFYQKACDGGYATGCYNLGVMYANGEGVAQDKAKAVAFYQKACDGGYATGCYNLGVMYANGEGVAQDKAKAVALYQKACNGGFATGCYNLGVMYENGEGVAQDKAKAVALYQKACNGGFATGCNNCVALYYYQLCTAENPAACAEGAKWIEATSQKKLPEGAKVEASWAIDLYKKAAQFYETACGKGDMVSCLKAADLFMDDKQADDPIKAVQLYQKACYSGQITGYSRLARLYESGSWVVKDLSKANALLKKACDAGGKEACSELISIQEQLAKAQDAPSATFSSEGGTIRGVLTTQDGAPARGIGLNLCSLSEPYREDKLIANQRPVLYGNDGIIGFNWINASKISVHVLMTNIVPIMTDATGAFHFNGVPEGEYAISPVLEKWHFLGGSSTGLFAVEEDFLRLPRRVIVKKGKETDIGKVTINTSEPKMDLSNLLKDFK